MKIRKIADKMIRLQTEIMKDPRTKNVVGFALVTVLAAIGFSLAQPTGQPAKLTSPASFPITMDGKQVGSTTLPIGAAVTVLETANGKVRVKANVGETWLPEADVLMGESVVASPAPVAAASASVQSTPLTKTEDQTPITTTIALPKQKEVIILLLDSYPPHLETLAAALEKDGFSVKTASQFKVLERTVTIRERSGDGVRDNIYITGEKTKPDILIPQKVKEDEMEALFGMPAVTVFQYINLFQVPNPDTINTAKYLWKKSKTKMVGEIDARKGRASIDEFVRAGMPVTDFRTTSPKALSVTEYSDVIGFMQARHAMARDYKPPTIDEIQNFGNTLRDALR